MYRDYKEEQVQNVLMSRDYEEEQVQNVLVSRDYEEGAGTKRFDVS